VQAFNRCAAGAGDLVFERAGMLAGLQNHFGRAQNSLRRKLRRNVARQNRRYAAVAQRLDKLINIGRAAAASSGHGVEQRFFHLKRDADGGKEVSLPVHRPRPVADLPSANAAAASPTSAGVLASRE